MRIILVLVSLCLGVLLHAQTSTYSRVMVDLTTGDEKDFRKAGLDLEHGTYIPGKVYVNDLASWEIDKLVDMGFLVDIMIDDVTEYYANQVQSRNPLLTCQHQFHDYPVPQNFHHGSMGGYLTYSEILDELDLMALKFPHLITTRKQVGTERTHQGRKLEWVRISDNPTEDEPEPEVLYTSLHHAREPMSMMQMIYYMWYLLENYDTDREVKYIVDNTEMYFVPCVNPDGYLYNEQIAPNGGGGWRKNMRDNDFDGEFNEQEDGVDLNRNYGFQWGFDDEGSSDHPGATTYRGPEPFSEPETRTLRTFINQRDFIFALNYHSYGNTLLYPWGFSGAISPDSLRYENYVEVLTSRSGFGAGTTEQALGYLANGVASDWMYAEHEIIAATPELGHEHHGFWPPEVEIVQYCQSAVHKNLSLAHLTQRFAVATTLDNDRFTAEQGEMGIRVKRYGMEMGSLAMAIQSLDEDLLIQGSLQEVGFELFEKEEYQVEYSFDPGAEQGRLYSFVISIDNGYFESRDTISRFYYTAADALTDNAEDIDNWDVPVGSSWGVTDEHAVSGDYSLTDSPGGLYSKSLVNSMILDEPVDLTEAVSAELVFKARWEIEEIIDYAMVEASLDGQGFVPLCGQYSKPGSIFQLPNEPIYDGTQDEWVTETMDLSLFAGDQVYLRFSLTSDILHELDGIYIDDIQIKIFYVDETTSVIPVDPSKFSFTQFPNPAASDVNVRIDLSELDYKEAELQIYDALGRPVYNMDVDSGQPLITVPTAQWPSGIYTSTLSLDGQVVKSERLVIAH